MSDAHTVAVVASRLETWAPRHTAESYDNVGLQVGRSSAVVTGIVVALDLTPQVIAEAETAGANLIITHHPLFFAPIKAITSASLVGSMALRMAEAGISHYAIHTNLDAARGGVSFALARQIGLENVTFLSERESDSDGTSTGLGAIGVLAPTMSTADFLAHVADSLGVPHLRHVSTPPREIRKVAVCGGSGSSLLDAALERGADAYVTADVKYHQFFDALDATGQPRLVYVDAGHYESEAVTEDLL
ncbi:MAG: dinuclear metal center YbgI/SA1388 family protein, partial [Rhodothermales bacterium]